MTHDPHTDPTDPTDADDALVARALDQPDAPEPLDQEGLAELHEVLSHLPFEEVEPPAGLEERVMAAALATRHPGVPARPVVPRRHRSRRWRAWAAPAVAAAAVAAAVVLVVTDTSDEPPGGRGRDATLVSRPRPDALEALLADPDARTATLTGEGGAGVGSAVLADDGRGQVYDLALATLAPGETYWLWLTSTGEPVRVGDLGPTPSVAAFEVDGEVDGVVVSVEAAGEVPERPGTTVAEGRFAGR